MRPLPVAYRRQWLKWVLLALSLLLALALAARPARAQAQPGPTVLVLYDAPSGEPYENWAAPTRSCWPTCWAAGMPR